MNPNLWKSGASATPPAAPTSPSVGYPTGGDPALGIEPTTGGAYWFYQLSQEIQALLTAAGITPDHTNLTQLLSAMNVLYSQGGTLQNLAGTANGISANVAYTADRIVLETSAGIKIHRDAFSMTIDTSTAGKNGLSTGVLAIDTWYAVFAGWDGAANCGWIDPSDTAPTVPAGVTHYARVGWIRTDGTANKYPLAFNQVGSSVQYVVAAGSNVPNYPIMASGILGDATVPTRTAVPWAAFLPPSAVRGRFVAVNGGGVGGITLCPNNNFGVISSPTNPPPLISYPTGYGAQAADWVLESANIYYTGTVASNAVQAIGWEDSL
jgi:hypothetical protein